MLAVNNLQPLDEVVRQHQSRIRGMAKATRCHPVDDKRAGEHPFRVWIGDHLIAWGESIRGGLPVARPDVRVEGLHGLVQRS